MTWKNKLNLNEAIQDKEVAEYLKNLGFEESQMHPTYYNEESLVGMIQTFDAPCLKLQKKIPQTSDWVTIYINDNEAYKERTSYSFEGSNYVKIDEPLTMENVDDILDELV